MLTSAFRRQARRAKKVATSVLRLLGLRRMPLHFRRMEPHIFTHFVPSNAFPDVVNHFRRTEQYGATAGQRRQLYLGGDCTLFEDHLPMEATMAAQLASQLPDWAVLNAGAPHYTSLHAYNRFVWDLVRGFRPKVVIHLGAVNDVLSFIHHKDGTVDPAHTHMYKPWLHSGGKSWDHLAESLSKTFFEEQHVKVARRLFHSTPYMACMSLFASACQTFGAQLVLTTYAYNPPDMLREPRLTYAWGIDELNRQLRDFSRAREIPLIDFANELDLLPERDIYNKWHYTKEGNSKRVSLVKRRLEAVLETPPVFRGTL